MLANKLLHDHLSDVCPDVHGNRLQAIMKVAYGLQKSQNLSLTAMGRKLNGDIDIKHKIKTVDRLENNKHLYDELSYIYYGLSNYLFKYLL